MPTKYRIKEYLIKFNEIYTTTLLKHFNWKIKRETDEVDDELSNQVKASADIGHFSQARRIRTDNMQRYKWKHEPNKLKRKGKTEPWWTKSLKTLRKDKRLEKRISTNNKQRGAKRE